MINAFTSFYKGTIKGTQIWFVVVYNTFVPHPTLDPPQSDSCKTVWPKIRQTKRAGPLALGPRDARRGWKDLVGVPLLYRLDRVPGWKGWIILSIPVPNKTRMIKISFVVLTQFYYILICFRYVCLILVTQSTLRYVFIVSDAAYRTCLSRLGIVPDEIISNVDA